MWCRLTKSRTLGVSATISLIFHDPGAWNKHCDILNRISLCLQVIVNSRLEIVEETGHMVMMEAPDHFNNIVHQFITQGFTKPSSISQKEELTNSGKGAAFNSMEKDKSSRSSSPWFSPRKKRPDSSKSDRSTSSIKSSKSRKSMPKGVLTHSLLWVSSQRLLNEHTTFNSLVSK